MCETCEFCGKSLVAIHSSRKNGKLGKDWDSRKYHKKCWKIMKSEQDLIFSLGLNLKWSDEKTIERLDEFKKKYNLTKLL